MLLAALSAAVALALAAAQPAWAAAQCSAASGAQRQALVELYTSEGCDSCPPAENWLSQVGPRTPGIVPLALHVDYWDSASWRDRFASPSFTERQQALSERAGSHIVYTPEVAVAGYELGNWHSADSFKAALARVAAQPSGAQINLGLSGSGAQTGLDASFSARPGEPAQAAFAYVAVYQNQLLSRIGGGENRGATLDHEFVVRQWLGPVPLVNGTAQIHQTVNLNPDGGVPQPDRFGVAAFVQAANGEVLQALALQACH